MTKVRHNIGRTIEHDLRNQLADLDDYLMRINDIMWRTWGIKDRPFTKDDGRKIMDVLEEWAKKY